MFTSTYHPDKETSANITNDQKQNPALIEEGFLEVETHTKSGEITTELLEKDPLQQLALKGVNKLLSLGWFCKITVRLLYIVTLLLSKEHQTNFSPLTLKSTPGL